MYPETDECMSETVTALHRRRCKNTGLRFSTSQQRILKLQNEKETEQDLQKCHYDHMPHRQHLRKERKKRIHCCHIAETLPVEFGVPCEQE
jgi:hypothetical protein